MDGYFPGFLDLGKILIEAYLFPSDFNLVIR